MKKIINSLLVVLFSSTVFAQYQYPATKTVEASDTYWGVTYKDPYRWLEDLKDPNVVSWFKAQADLTNETMTTIAGRDELIAEWRKLDKQQPPVIYYPIKEGVEFFIKRECQVKK